MKGFFQLGFFVANSVHLMGFAFHSSNDVSPGTVYFSLAGNFGWWGSPNAFEVFTRLFRVILSVEVVGRFLMYGDDFMVASSKHSWQSDSLVIISVIYALFGSKAYAEEKFDYTEVTGKADREVDMLEWNFNLTTNRFSVSHRNQLRALYLLEGGFIETYVLE